MASHVYRDMFSLVRAAKEAKTFEEDSRYYRELQQDIQKQEPAVEDKKDAAPVFNKRLFASQVRLVRTVK